MGRHVSELLPEMSSRPVSDLFFKGFKKEAAKKGGLKKEEGQ